MSTPTFEAAAISNGVSTLPDGMTSSSAFMVALTRTVDQIAERYSEIAAAVNSAPLAWTNLYHELEQTALSGEGVRAFTYVLLLLMIGASVEAFYWINIFGSMRVLLNLIPSSPRTALVFAFRRLCLSFFGLLLFFVAAIGSASTFTWPAGIYDIVATLTVAMVLFRALMIIADTILSPGAPHLRLVQCSNMTARVLTTLSALLAILTIIEWVAPISLQIIGGTAQLSELIRLTAGTMIALIILIANVWYLRVRSEKLSSERRSGILPRFPRTLSVGATITLVYALWLYGSSVAAIFVFTVALTIALQISLRPVVFYFWRDKMVSGLNTPPNLTVLDNANQIEPALAPSIILPAVRLLLLLVGMTICAVAMDVPLFDIATSDSPTTRLAFRLIGVVALTLLADVAWITVKTTIDFKLATLSNSDRGPLESAARLLTLLPILRMSAAVVLLVLLVLSSLWTLGLEVTPLLASAGVVGLAFGFGAQSLVKDIITGVFYLAEDTFRVGEYIESGSSTKGTVERLSLRTVALRHHNGPLHFVPYGTLGTVRNTSRDWVIEKFNLPLPIDVDSEKVRKLIKKVGEEMMLDEDLGPLMLQPLKGKLYRVEPGVKIFRCNFQTAPGNQFDVRAAAYKRIEAALLSAGITYASHITPKPGEMTANA